MLARTPTDLGNLIREQRRKLSLDQRALAERVGVSRQWIVEVEGGKPRAEIGLVLRTLSALGLELEVRPKDAPQIEPGVKVGTPRVSVDLNELIDQTRKRQR